VGHRIKPYRLRSFVNLILRHQPEIFGVNLDTNGFCKINELVNAINHTEHWSSVNRTHIYELVTFYSKNGFTIEGDKIKANYGHSIVELQPKR